MSVKLKIPVEFDEEFDLLDSGGFPVFYGAGMVYNHPEIGRHIEKVVNYHDRLVKALDDLQLVAACIDYDVIEPKLSRARDILAELDRK